MSLFLLFEEFVENPGRHTKVVSLEEIEEPFILWETWHVELGAWSLYPFHHCKRPEIFHLYDSVTTPL